MRESQLAIFCHVLSGASVAVWRNGSCEKEKETVQTWQTGDGSWESVSEKHQKKVSLSPLLRTHSLSLSLSHTHTQSPFSPTQSLRHTISLSVTNTHTYLSYLTQANSLSHTHWSVLSLSPPLLPHVWPKHIFRRFFLSLKVRILVSVWFWQVANVQL